MSQLMRQSVKQFGAITALLVAAFVVFFSFGPQIEQALLPRVYTQVNVNFIEVDAQRTKLLVSGVKQRNCALVSSRVEVETDAGWVPGESRMLNVDGSTLTPENSRIGVGQHFVRQVEITPGGKAINMDVEVRCHPLWMSITRLFKISNPDPALVR